MRTHTRLRLAINVLVGILLGLLISQLLSACSDQPMSYPAPSAGIAGEAPAEAEPRTAKSPAVAKKLSAPNTVKVLQAPAAVESRSLPGTMPLPQTSARYHLSWDGKLEGDAIRSLTCKASQCRYETHAQVPGLASLSEVSDFRWANGHVEFQRYQRTLQLLFKQVLQIEKQADGSIRSERRGKVYQYAGKPDLVDILSIEVQLRADRLAGRTPKASYPLADSKGISAIRLHREANETLTLVGKARPCEVYVRQDGNRKTTLWLNPEQAFLPLQIVHQDGAETYRMVWTGDV
jgi:hypothetical protein